MNLSRPLLLLLLVLTAVAVGAPPEPRVAIQPRGQVPAEVVAVIRAKLGALYRVRIEVLPERELPVSAYFRPRGRYRAEKLLAWLEKETPAGVDKVIGVTASDISTTKGEVPDWGIFGLGQLDRRPCVVSTFRLGRGVPLATMHRRIGDVAGHEIGHTFNLPHCATPRCMMNDAGGKVKVVDDSTGELCPACREKLGELVTGR
jgi:archaemetzincin